MEIAKIEFPLKLILHCLFDLKIPSADMLMQAFLAPFLDYKDDLSPGSKNLTVLHVIPVYEHNCIPAYSKTPPNFSA